jgi:two-component system sensor histidine kinase DesK
VVDVHGVGSEKLEFSPMDWPDWRNGDDEYSRKGHRGGVFGAAIFLFFLISPVLEAFQHSHTTGFRVVLVADVVAYAVCYPVVLWFGPRSSHASRVLMVAGMFALGTAITVIQGDLDSLVFLSYAIASALMLLPLRWGRIIGLVVAATLVVLELAIRGSVTWDNIWTLALLTLGMSSFFQLLNTIGMLRAARRDVAELAIAEERARMARDLHDVLGHSLTTITLKTGLARRMLESGAERERAIPELQEVELLSRQALTEIRSTLSGYRKASLAAELVGARMVLQSAEITADLPRAIDDVRADLQEPFAYVLREGITNVIRHSGANRCEVRLGENWLQITDNGTGPRQDDGGKGHGGKGHGLAGLAERLRNVGGELDAAPLAKGGFRVLASVALEPARPEPETEAAEVR